MIHSRSPSSFVSIVIIAFTIASIAFCIQAQKIVVTPISVANGVSGSLQCTKNSAESYAICAGSNRAVKYNLRPFSFAARSSDLGNYMFSCDLYEPTSQSSTPRVICFKSVTTAGTVYFLNVSDMSITTTVQVGISNYYSHVIVDSPNQIAYISNNDYFAPTIYKIVNIGSAAPSLSIQTVTAFGPGGSGPTAMLAIGEFLYVHLLMDPASRLARINTSSFNWSQTVNFTGQEVGGSFDNLANDDNFIYDITQYGILIRCTYNNNTNFAKFDTLHTGFSGVNSLSISPDFSFLLFTAELSGVVLVNTSSSFHGTPLQTRALFPGTTGGYTSAFGRPIILSKQIHNASNDSNNTSASSSFYYYYAVCGFGSSTDLFTFNISENQVFDNDLIFPVSLAGKMSSAVNTSSGVSGSLQCSKNSDESYAVCASISNIAVKYNLHPFSFAAQGPKQDDFMTSCDLYETSSQTTSRVVCVQGRDTYSGSVFFYRVSNMSVAATIIYFGATGDYPHVIVDTPNQIAYVSNCFGSPNIYKITNIGGSNPQVIDPPLSSFGSGDYNPSAMLIIDGFLYVHLSMAPARLARINISTFTWNQTVKFLANENNGNYDNLANDGDFLYDLSQNGFVVRCRYNNGNFSRIDSLNLKIPINFGGAPSLAISNDQRTLFAVGNGLSLLQMIDVFSFAMIGNPALLPSGRGRPIITSDRYVYAFGDALDSVFGFRFAGRTETQSSTETESRTFHNVSTPTWPISESISSSLPSESISNTRSNSPPNTSTVTHSRSFATPSPSSSRSLSNNETISHSRTSSHSPSSAITTSQSSSASQSSSMSISANVSISESITVTKSETIADCSKILDEYKCNSSHCQWCRDLGACVRPIDDCSSFQCSSFSNAAWKYDTNLCPNLTCHFCPKTRTCLSRIENPVCSCSVASTSSSACGAAPGECFWCKNDFKYFGRAPNSVKLCIHNETNRSAEDQFCSCQFLPKDICTSSVTCAWCNSTGGCFDTSVKSCDKVTCTDFTNVAAVGQCPSPLCQICDGICVKNNTEYAGDRCNVKYFDQTTCEGCHNCTWNEKVLAGVNDAQPYCVMSQNASSCPSPLTCSSINLPGFDHENQCLAAGCKYDTQKKECRNFLCFNLFLKSFVIQPLGLMIIGFIKDVVMLLLFGVFGDVVLKILKRKLIVPFKFWKNKWDKNRIKVNLERTIYVNDSKARDFTSEKGESFEQYCEKIAEKFFELPETNDEEIRKDWKRRIVDAVTFAMFDTGLWFDLDNDGYGKLDDEKEPKKLNGVEALMMNDAHEENENQNQEQEIEQKRFTPRETESNSEIMQHATVRKLVQQHEKQLHFLLQNASQEVAQRFNDQFTNASARELQQPVKKLFIAEDALILRPVLQAIVERVITEHATCVLYYASSRVTSIRAATALNSFPSPLQLFYYLLGIIFLVSSSLASVLNYENQAVISRIASYSCTSSNSTSSASSDVGVFKSTYLILGFRLMNASTVATVFLVLVKTVRAIWASYVGRFNQLQLPQRLPIMGLYTKRSGQILLGFYFGVVLIFALVGFFYGFKLTASLKVIGITVGIFVGDALLLNLIRFLTSRFQEKDFEKQTNEIKVEEEELASRLNLHVNFDQSKNQEPNNNDFDEVSAGEIIDVKKQSLSNSAPTSLPQALIVFLLSEEFPTILLTISLQLCYNYMCLVEYKSSFGFTDESMSEISAKEYESRSMDCIWELFQNDVSGYANVLSSFVAFL